MKYVLIQTHDESGALYCAPMRSYHRTALGAKRAAAKAGGHRARIEHADGGLIWRLDGGRWQLSSLSVGDLLIDLRPGGVDHPGWDDLSTDLDDPEAVWGALSEYAGDLGWGDWHAEVHVITGSDSSRLWLRCSADGWGT